MNTTRPLTRSVVLLAALNILASWMSAAQAADGPDASSRQEEELIALLRSEAPPAEKAIACKLLAIHGTSAAVPELSPLLFDEQLASWARIALEAIPGEAADEALRKAAESLQGKLLVGAINSIGVRRDVEAVDQLTARLKDQDSEAASAAAVALGQIGNAAAAKSLRKALAIAPQDVRSAVAEGCVLCAERALAAGDFAQAGAIYDEVRAADVPKQRILEATRGAILARRDAGIPLLVEQFQSPDKGLFNIALSTARELPGREVDAALAAELDRATPERAALLIQAMADRRETVVLSAVLAAAGQGPREVRLAAIAALGRVGDISCLSPLLDFAIEEDAELTETAKGALAEVAGENVDAEIIARLAAAEGKMHPLLLELVGRRRIDALPALLKGVEHSDPSVRGAALTALGQTVRPEQLSVLVSQVVAPQYPEDTKVAQRALMAACVRMPDREVCAAEVAAALEGAPTETKGALLNVLGAVGGTQALQAIGAAAKSDVPELQDASTRLLGEWMTADAAPVLLELTTATGEKYQGRALRGYLRIARQFIMPENERAAMCRKAFAAARTSAEQKLVLEVLNRYPNAETLALAVEAAEVDELKDDATQTALSIAQRLGGDAAGAELLARIGLEKVKLEIVKAEYGAGEKRTDVTEVLQRQAGDLPLISLPSANYNESFGGDPAPDVVKQLSVQYRINGKAGEAVFAENALILLPIPE